MKITRFGNQEVLNRSACFDIFFFTLINVRDFFIFIYLFYLTEFNNYWLDFGKGSWNKNLNQSKYLFTIQVNSNLWFWICCFVIVFYSARCTTTSYLHPDCLKPQSTTHMSGSTISSQTTWISIHLLGTQSLLKDVMQLLFLTFALFHCYNTNQFPLHGYLPYK